MNNRRDFFKGLLSLLPVAVLADLPIVTEAPKIRIINDLGELMSMHLQYEIDYDMISRMVQVAAPGTNIPNYKQPVEGVDFILSEDFSTNSMKLHPALEQNFLHS